MAGEGAQKLQKLLAGGFTPQEAQDWRDRTAARLSAGGFTQDEITDYFGEEREQSDMAPVQQHFVSKYAAASGAADPGAAGLDFDAEFKKFVEAGWQHGVWSLVKRKPTEEVDLEHASLRDRIGYKLAQTVGDLPAMVAGAGLGAAEGGGVGSAITAFGGAAALPAGMRRVMMEKYANGEIQSPERFMEVASAAIVDAFHQYVVGGATGAAGVGGRVAGEALAGAGRMAGLEVLPTIAPAVADYSAQIATMTTLGAAVEGQLPRLEDFEDAAVLVGGLGAATHGAAKLREVFSNTGFGPLQVLEHAAKDPTIVEDVLSKNVETPRAYRAQEEAEAARSPGDVVPEEARAQAQLEGAADDAGMKARQVVRYGSEIDVSKPQGAYTTPGSVESPHADLGQRFEAFRNPEANVLEVDASELIRSPRNHGGLVGQSAGIAALTKFIGKEETQALINAPKAEVRARMEALYPNVDWSRYYDSQEMLEGYAGLLARERGYDAIYAIDNGAREFDEYVGLSQKAFLPPKPPPAEAASAAETPTPPSTPYDRVLARLSIGENAPKQKWTWNQFYTNWVDRFHPLYRVVKAMADGQTLPLLQDAYKLARLKIASFAKAEHFLRYGAFRYGDVSKIIGPAFQKIIKPVRDDLDGLRVYLASRRALEYERRGLESGIDPADAAAEVARLEPRFGRVAEQLYEYQDHVLNYLKDVGFLDDARYAEMKRLNEDFVPFHRLFEEEGTKGGGRGLRVLQPLRRVKGGDQPIVDPLESIVKNTHFLIEMAERNRVARSFIELAESSRRGSDFAQRKVATARPIKLTEAERTKLVDKVLGDEPLTAEQEAALGEDFSIFRRNPLTAGKDEIAIYRDGEREVWKVTPEIWQVFEGSSAGEASILRKVLETPTKLLRAGSVLSPEFIARNVPRDLVSAFVFADGLFSPINTLRGFTSAVTKDEAFQLWQRSGGGMAELVSLDREYLQGNLKELVEKHGAYDRVRNVVRHPIESLRILSELSEQSTRVGVFKKELGRGATPEEAAFASREATLDFNRAGVKAQAVNRLVAFFNAQIQGLDKVARSFDPRNPKKAFETTAKTVAGITLPSVVLYLLNRDEPGWDEIPQWQKDLFWLVHTDAPPSWLAKKLGVAFEPGPGMGTWWRIPKPFELGVIFGSGAERMVAKIMGDLPGATEAEKAAGKHAFDDFLGTLYRGATPNVVPTAAIPVAEAWANRSLFMDRPIVPERYEDILPDFQSQPYTTEVTKAIGSLVARIPGLEQSRVASPLIIENTIRDLTGGLGMHILKIANASLQKAGILPESVDPTPTLSDLPLIGGFSVRYPSMGANSIQTLFEHYGEQQKVINTLSMLDNEGDLDGYQKLFEKTGGGVDLSSWATALSELTAIYRATYKDPGIGRDEKRQALDQLTLQMIEIAKDGNRAYEEAQADAAEASSTVPIGAPQAGAQGGGAAASPPTLH